MGKQIPVTIYDYADKQTKIWMVPEGLYKEIIASKANNNISPDEPLSLNVKVVKDPLGFDKYEVEPMLTWKQKVKRYFANGIERIFRRVWNRVLDFWKKCK